MLTEAELRQAHADVARQCVERPDLAMRYWRATLERAAEGGRLLLILLDGRFAIYTLDSICETMGEVKDAEERLDAAGRTGR